MNPRRLTTASTRWARQSDVPGGRRQLQRPRRRYRRLPQRRQVTGLWSSETTGSHGPGKEAATCMGKPGSALDYTQFTGDPFPSGARGGDAVADDALAWADRDMSAAAP